jgi:hypothetical protein
MRWESMIVPASFGITSRFISRNRSGRTRRLNPNSKVAPWSASSKERKRHWILFIQRRRSDSFQLLARAEIPPVAQAFRPEESASFVAAAFLGRLLDAHRACSAFVQAPWARHTLAQRVSAGCVVYKTRSTGGAARVSYLRVERGACGIQYESPIQSLRQRGRLAFA